MNTNTQRGFIPLVAIIAIGIALITGGTVATISLTKDKRQENSNISIQESEEAELTSVDSTNEAKTSSTESSAPTGVNPSSKIISTTPEDHSKPVILSAKSKEICEWVVQEERDRTKASLIVSLDNLCNGLQAGKYQGDGLEEAQVKLHDLWQIYIKAVVEARQRDFERRDTDAVVDSPEDIAERERVRQILESNQTHYE